MSALRAFPGLVLMVGVGACVGPPAPDNELCHDVIQRFCAAPHCATAAVSVNLPEMDCENELLRRTGCGAIDFAFTTPSRSRVLDCRLPLVRDSSDRLAHPACEYVDETMRNCPDLTRFLSGTP